jgi:hypothetical protein
MNLVKLNGIVRIFKGDTINQELEHRGDFVVVDDFNFKIDITGFQTSEIKFEDPQRKIQIGDVIYKSGDVTEEVVAIVKSVNYEYGLTICDIALDIDILDLELVITNSIYNFSVGQVFSRFSPYEIYINFNEVVTSTDKFTTLDTLLRQACRKQHLKSVYSIVNNKLRITLSPTNQAPTKLSFHDVDLIECAVRFSNDNYNLIKLYNQDDFTITPKSYFLDKNGNVITAISDDVLRPIIDKSFEVESVVFNSATDSLKFATSELKKQDYDNEIVFKVGNIKNLEFLSTNPLGTIILFYDQNCNEIRTILSKIEFDGNLIYTLGVSRRRFSDQKNQDK